MSLLIAPSLPLYSPVFAATCNLTDEYPEFSVKCSELRSKPQLIEPCQGGYIYTYIYHHRQYPRLWIQLQNNSFW